MKHYLLYLLSLCLCFSTVLAQNSGTATVVGTLVDADTDETLIGASILLKGTTIGTVTNFDGSFRLGNIPAGNQVLTIQYVGYETTEEPVLVKAGETYDLGAFAVKPNSTLLGEVVINGTATDRKTPVAITTIKGELIEERLGNQEFPEILKTTPGVYTTKTGGGFGDARINIRGFDQRNTAVLINGIPVNDMENGWVYWSNWAGLSDVTRSKQVQRGLGASKLAIASVGGTINIVTKTTDQEAGGNVSIMTGNDNFLKYGLTLSTGRIGDGWAFTFSGSRTTGDGYVDAAYIDAWSYFGSISKEINKKHTLSLTAIGAPQRHGQRSFRENVRKYVGSNDAVKTLEDQKDEAGESWTDAQEQQLTEAYRNQIIDGKVSDFDERKEAETDKYGNIKYSSVGNIRYNSDWGFRDGEIFNIRENFYHKPQIALNHFWTASDKFFLGTSVYYSLGRGGGTGDRGSIAGRGTWGFRNDDGLIEIDKIFAWNSGTDNLGGSFPEEGHHQDPQYGFVASEDRDDSVNKGLIKRASMNEHNWMGVLSKAQVSLTDQLSLVGGVDLRQYTGLHYRKVVDLMGNDYWLDSRDVNNVNLELNTDGDFVLDSLGNSTGVPLIDKREKGKLVTADDGLLGNPGQENKIHYDNDGVVGWQGAFAELEYSQDNLTGFVSGSVSNTSYKRVDRFNYLIGSENETSNSYNFLGYNLKAGANFNIDKRNNVFVNAGYYSRAPDFDTVFPNFNNVDVNEGAENEKVLGFEAGYGFRTSLFAAKINAYYTNWQDKSLRRYIPELDGDANVLGLDAVHQGVELELNAEPVDGLNLNAAVGLGDWQWKNDVEAIISDQNSEPVDTVTVYADGLYVGDAAQTNLALGASYGFDFGLGIDANYVYFDRLYANFDPTDRSDIADKGKQALQLPSYGLLDLGLSYKFKFNGIGAKLRFNMNNVLDELYVAEANDADSLYGASAFFGFGRTWNVGLKVSF